MVDKAVMPSVKEVENKPCGLVMPISASDVYDAEHWIDVRAILERAITAAGYSPQPVWESTETDIIQGRIVRNLHSLDMVVCDISGLNPNVMFELGMRLTFRKPTLIVVDDVTRIPFDTNVIEHMIYPSDLHFRKIEGLIAKVAERIGTLAKACKEGTYKPYIDSFGAFTVVQPEDNKVEFDQYVLTQLDKITSTLTAIQRTAAPSSSSEISMAQSDAIRSTRDKVLRALWDEGRTASQIGDVLGISRNAVIGRAHRLGLQARPSPVAAAEPEPS